MLLWLLGSRREFLRVVPRAIRSYAVRSGLRTGMLRFPYLFFVLCSCCLRSPLLLSSFAVDLCFLEALFAVLRSASFLLSILLLYGVLSTPGVLPCEDSSVGSILLQENA